MKLIIEDDEGRKTIVPIVREEITIGRQEKGNTIRLTERNVSRRHARLLRTHGNLFIEDLGSFNGTKVNGEKISGRRPIREGDLIEIGDYDLAVQGRGEDAVVEPKNGAPPERVPVAPAEATSDSITKPLPRPPTPPGGGRREATAVIKVLETTDPSAEAELNPVLIPAGEAPRLACFEPRALAHEFTVDKTVFRLGRTQEDNDLAVDHRSISRTHARLVRGEDGQWTCYDLQSANGIKVNGETYGNSPLRLGDVLELGHVKFKFLAAGEKMTAAPSPPPLVPTGAAVAAPAVTAPIPPRNPTATAPEETITLPYPSRHRRAPLLAGLVLLLAGTAGVAWVMRNRILQAPPPSTDPLLTTVTPPQAAVEPTPTDPQGPPEVTRTDVALPAPPVRDDEVDLQPTPPPRRTRQSRVEQEADQSVIRLVERHLLAENPVAARQEANRASLKVAVEQKARIQKWLRDKIESNYQSGLQAIREGRPEEATRLIGVIEKLDANHPHVDRLKRKVAVGPKGRSRDEGSLLPSVAAAQAMTRDPKGPSAFQEGEAAHDKKDYATCATKLEQAVRQEPNNADAHRMLGTCYNAKGDHPQKAYCHIARYLKLKPGARDAARFQQLLSMLEEQSGVPDCPGILSAP
jgi:pSer/pThr/pTyr-binding forkhead associated (FHA) protein